MWISVEQELPELGVPVHVDGDYVAPDTGHPTAQRCRCPFMQGEHWESTEWRGTVAIRRWWKEDSPDNEEAPA